MSRVTRRIDTLSAKTEHGEIVRINIFQEFILSRTSYGVNEASGDLSYVTTDGTAVKRNEDGTFTILGGFSDIAATIR
jgi:hypothetical protein